MIDYNKLSQAYLNNELLNACKTGDLELAKYLVSSDELKCHAEVFDNKWEAVKLAVGAGQIEIVKYFFAAIQNEYPNIIFNTACKTGQLEILKFLYSTADYQDNKKGSCYYGVLMAVAGGHVPILDYYLTSPDLAPFTDTTKINDFLHMAVHSGHIHILDYFLNSQEFSSVIDFNHMTKFFCSACASGHIHVLDYFLNSKEFSSALNFNQLDQGFSNACASNHIHILDYLVKIPKFIQNNSINYVFNKGMFTACDNNQMEVMKHLIYNFNINLATNTKDHLISAGRDDILELIKLRDLNKNLQKELGTNSQIQKKVKI